MIHFIDEAGSAPWADLCEAYYSGERSDVSFYLDQSSQVGGTVLELGCSTGRITELLAEFGKLIHAVDPSTSQLNFARAKMALLTNLTFFGRKSPNFSQKFLKICKSIKTT